MLLEIARTQDVLRLSGEIDLAVADDVQTAILGAFEDGIAVIDMSEVTFLDSAGIRALLTAARAVEARGTLVVQEPSAAVTRVLEIVLPHGAAGLDVRSRS
jgi:anti-anti-sigma factor